MINPVVLPEAFNMSSMNVPRKAAGTSKSFISASGPTQAPGSSYDLSLPSITFGNPKKCIPLPPPPHVCEPALRETTGSVVVAGYFTVGMVLAVTSIVAEGLIGSALTLVTPMWTVTILLHSMCRQGTVMGLGITLLFLFPVFVVFRDLVAWVAYIVAFSAFASYNFWREQRGARLILCGLAWMGILSALTCAVVFNGEQLAKPLMQLGVVFSLVLAMTCSHELARFQYKVFEN